jgi:hypothetical protein
MSEVFDSVVGNENPNLDTIFPVVIDIESASTWLQSESEAFGNQQPTDFWRQCVRDASGRWERYSGHSSRFGVKYFRGYQPNVDYSNPAEVEYLRASFETRRKFYETLPSVTDMGLEDFRAWLEELRSSIQYRPTEEWLHQRFATPAHDLLVREQVLPIAHIMGDPYVVGVSKGPVFEGIPENAQPHDELIDGKIVHNYPTLKHSEAYFSEALVQLKELMSNQNLSRDEYLEGIENFYQLLTNLHYFAAMNASLYMNMANGLLEVAGIKGIENGIIDFVALRLQPANFQQYFAFEVDSQTLN